MDAQVEYYYGEALRWSFGFENPNKAAVLFACAIPLLWFLGMLCWRVGRLWLRVPLLVVSSAILLGAWYCLMMTYSRGGLVAAGLGLGYMGLVCVWPLCKNLKNFRFRGRLILSILLILVMLGGVVWSGMGKRSAAVLGDDRSVGNRIELWGGALQMAVENPRGFGAGRSGAEYMQWYQAIGREEGYRTMVNSYLTFLVERGWLSSLGILGFFLLFWNWTRAERGEFMVLALRGALVAFLVAAFFSTTMEEIRLWFLPMACVSVLVWVTVRKKQALAWKSLIGGGGLVLWGGVFLLGYGAWRSGKDDLQREFGKVGKHFTVTAVAPRGFTGRSIRCLVDENIVGAGYAKLLREMALKASLRVSLKEEGAADVFLAMGSQVRLAISKPSSRLCLLAPEMIAPEEVSLLFQNAKQIDLLVPEIDEDGRVDFWESLADEDDGKRVKIRALSGVGNRVDWAWEEVIDVFKSP